VVGSTFGARFRSGIPVPITVLKNRKEISHAYRHKENPDPSAMPTKNALMARVVDPD
jgi:hypothetical protein